MSQGIARFMVPAVAATAPAQYREFWELWRQERFFECHEALETLWRVTGGRQRWFYNGLINCAVAVYQHRRGNAVGAARQLTRAQVKLEPFRPCHDTVDVDELLGAVAEEIASSLTQLSAAQRAGCEEIRKFVNSRMQRDFADAGEPAPI